jgi:lambda family phage portal protein
MARSFDPFGFKARAEIAKYNAISQTEKTRRAEISGKIALISQMFGRAAKGSFQNDLFESAEKTPGALTGASILYNSSPDSLRRLSRLAVLRSPTGESMVNRLAEVVVGSGLRLRPQPYWDIIDPAGAIDEKARAKWEKNVEQRYRMWGKSYSPEYNTRRNLPQLSRACFDYLLQDGEYFVLLRYANTREKNPLTIQIIPPENIRGGYTNIPGHEVVNGIEYDAYGEAVAYFILDDKTGKTQRVSRFGEKSGRIMMIHNFLSSNEKQRRGVPYLASCIQELIKLGHYEDLEIQAAIVNALFAVWVKPPENEDGTPIVGGGGAQRASARTKQTTSTADPETTEYVSKFNTLDIKNGGIIADALPAGHEIQSFDTSRPNVNFGTFFSEVKKNIAASKNMPLSVVDLAFNGSYSGARGELLMFWMSVNRFRENHGYDFEDDVYQMWFIGEVARGRIDAPGSNTSKEMFLAYTNAQWIGNQRPDIDPLKSVNAHILEQKYGYKTGAEITAERTGGDYNENLEKIKSELDRVAEANAPMEAILRENPEEESIEEENSEE